VPVVNLDLFPGDQVDIAGDALQLPLAPASVDTVICTGVLEHLPDPSAAVLEIVRVLKPGGRVYAETPFMQTYHASPGDYHRWTFQGLAWIFHDFEILEIRVASGPASALAWQLQQTAAMLFSFRSDFIYRVGLRIFGWLAVPVAWLDIFLEQHPSSRNAASGFALIARKPEKEST
jgi:SAM-dependent methyltransferase